MADIIQKVSDGDSLNIPASAYNAFVDTANWYKSRTNRSGVGSGGGGPVFDTTELSVVNKSGQNIQRFRAITLTEPCVLPASSEDNFLSQVSFKGDVPHAGYKGRWGIAQTSMIDGAYGTAVAYGFTIAWINIVTVADKFVEIQVASIIPQSGSSGYGQIMWVAGGVGTATATGEQWAVLRLGVGGIGVGQYQYTVYQTVAQNVGGWDNLMGSPALP
jgi:hypothetical protein